MLTFVVAIAVIAIQAKHNNEMLSLQEMIEKSLLLRKSPSITLLPNSDTTTKAYFGNNSLPKTIKRWNQAKFRYFDPYLDRIYEEGEIVLIGKEV